jgi:hypothetical protein
VKVYINKREVTIFEGAHVADAVLRFSLSSYTKFLKGELRIIDSFGNHTEPDGPLTDGQDLRLMKSTPEK